MIDSAKKEVEKEREILMSRSLPGFTDSTGNNQSFDNESASDSDSESEDNGNSLAFAC